MCCSVNQSDDLQSSNKMDLPSSVVDDGQDEKAQYPLV